MNILSEMSSIYYELTISEKRIAELANLRKSVMLAKLQLLVFASVSTHVDIPH